MRNIRFKTTATLAGGIATLAAAPALAAGAEISVTIPQLKVAEYHRPYVAIWIEPKAAGAVRNVAVWYDVDMKNNEGTKWLRDIRGWWRKTGRTLTMPVNGVSGATKAPGTHKIASPLAGLAPGSYELVVEAAREVGGREVVRVPFSWPAKAPATAKAAGTAELGAVSIALKP